MDDGDAYNACVCGTTQQQSRQPNKMWEKGGEMHEPGRERERERGIRECREETKAPKQRKRATHVQKLIGPGGSPMVARYGVWWLRSASGRGCGGNPFCLWCGCKMQGEVGEASVLMCGSGSSWVGQRGGGRMSHSVCRREGGGGGRRGAGREGRGIPFSAFWLRSSVVSVLISLISDTRLIEPHDINLIYFGCGPIRQLAARASARRLGLALPPRPAQPTPPPFSGGDPPPTMQRSKQEESVRGQRTSTGRKGGRADVPCESVALALRMPGPGWEARSSAMAATRVVIPPSAHPEPRAPALASLDAGSARGGSPLPPWP